MTGNPAPALSGARSPALLVFAIAMLLHAVIGAWTTGAKEQGVDFYHFWVVPQVVARHESRDIYDEGERKKLAWNYWARARTLPVTEQRRYQEVSDKWSVLETTATPFLYTFFYPWGTGNYEHDYLRYQVILSACGMAALLLLAGLLGYPLAMNCIAAAVCTDWFEPFQSDIRVANVNRLLLLGIALYLWTRSRRERRWASFGGGAIMGLLVMFKPIVLGAVGLAAIGKLIRGNRRDLVQEVAGIGAGAGAAFAVSSAFFGDWRVWLRWVEQLRRFPDWQITVRMGNYAPAMLMQEWWGWKSTPVLVAGVALLVLAGSYMGLLKSARRVPSPDAASDLVTEARLVSLGLLAFLLCSKLAWLHYFLLTTPALLVACRPAAWQDIGWWPNAIRCSALVVATLLIALNPPIAALNIGDPRTWAALVTLGTLTLFGVTMADLIRDRPDHLTA